MNEGSSAFTSDAPAIDPKHDRFRRYEFAKRVADTLSSHDDPNSLTVAINGAWGEGKTTVLEYIASELRHLPGVVCVRFNPWRFSDEVGLLSSFFETLAASLERSLATNKEKLGEALRKYGGFASFASIEVNGLKWSAGEVLKNLGGALGTADLDETKERLEKLLIEERKRIIILIDDIDRLDKTEIQAVFRLVKLTANFPFTSYVLAFDQDMVADAIASSYGGGNLDAGRSFLEKIIQVPLNLPAADPSALRDFCLEYIDRSLRVVKVEWDDKLRSDFLTKFYLYLAPRLDTPRSAKRYANALAFTMPLLFGEVHPLDVLLLEGMKIFYPRIYSAIRRVPAAFTGSRESFSLNGEDEASLEIVSTSLSDLDRDGRERARLFLEELFPQLRGLFRSKKYESSSRAIWDKKQRVASADYLWRYLTLSIPQGDVSDQVINKLIQDLVSLPDTQASAELKELFGAGAIDNVLYKINIRLFKLDEATAAKVALLIARNGGALPESGSLLAFGSVMHRASLLIRELLRRIEAPAVRSETAESLVQYAQPLPLAYECVMMLGPDPKDFGGDILSPESYTALKKRLAKRISVEAEKGSLIGAFPKDYPLLLLLWSQVAGRAPVHAYVRKLIQGHPRDAVSILMAQFQFTPPSNTFSPRTYENLLNFADPVDVRAAAQNLGDGALSGVEQQAVNEFVALYEQKQAAPESNEEPAKSAEGGDAFQEQAD